MRIPVSAFWTPFTVLLMSTSSPPYHFLSNLDENDEDGRQSKRRVLEPLLETDAKFLLHDYTQREDLLALFDRAVELEDLVRFRLRFF